MDVSAVVSEPRERLPHQLAVGHLEQLGDHPTAEVSGRQQIFTDRCP